MRGEQPGKKVIPKRESLSAP